MKPIASMTITNTCAIVITDIDTYEDKVTFYWDFGQPNKRLNRSNLRSDWKGRLYFISRNQRYYINNFIKL